MKNDVLAILVADIHLTTLKPACRNDKDWMETQAFYLDQLKKFADGSPILCAGDIFDRWNTSPELINFALKYLPDGMICVPGQHDLPNHRIDLMDRCGYGVLRQTGKIQDISNRIIQEKGMRIYGFGWGQSIKSPKRDPGSYVQVALAHQYVWQAGSSYPGAPDSSHVSKLARSLEHFHVGVFGDNHKGFTAKLAGKVVVHNCGGFIRRKTDEMDYEPSMGILYGDGTVKRVRFDTSIDRFHAIPEDKKSAPLNMKAFLDGLEGLGEHGLNFQEAVENYLKTENVDPKVKEIILSAIT